MRKARATALCGVTAALSFVLLLGTTAFPVLLYVLPIVTGFFVQVVSDASGKGSAVSVYAVTSLLSLLFLTEKEAALAYALFFGYYPLLRDLLHRLPRLVRVLLKALLFNAAAVVTELLAAFVFGVPWENDYGRYTALILLTLGNAVFWAYDYVLGRYRPLSRRFSKTLAKRFRLS